MKIDKFVIYVFAKKNQHFMNIDEKHSDLWLTMLLNETGHI